MPALLSALADTADCSMPGRNHDFTNFGGPGFEGSHSYLKAGEFWRVFQAWKTIVTELK